MPPTETPATAEDRRRPPRLPAGQNGTAAAPQALAADRARPTTTPTPALRPSRLGQTLADTLSANAAMPHPVDRLTVALPPVRPALETRVQQGALRAKLPHGWYTAAELRGVADALDHAEIVSRAAAVSRVSDGAPADGRLG